MATPKSAKLLREESVESKNGSLSAILDNIPRQSGNDEIIKIREIPCLNDFVAILMKRVESGIDLPENQQYRNEGVVVGIGPGVPDGTGHRTPSQLKLGDVVLFMERSIVTGFNSAEPPYKGQRVVVISERSLICKLPPVKFEIIT